MNVKRFYGNLIYALSMTLIIVMRILVSAGAFSSLSDTSSDLVWSLVVQCVVMGLIPFSLYLIFLKKRGVEKPLGSMLEEFGYTRSPSAKGWLIVVVISVLSTFLVTCVSNVWYGLISLFGYKAKITAEVPYTVGTLFIALFTTAILPPMFEEFTNRGLLYRAHGEGKSPFRVILLTSFMFALMHTNVTQVFYTFVFGMVAGALVYTTKSIWPAVVYHFVNNLVSVLKSYGRINDNGLRFLTDMYGWLFGTVAGIIVCVALFIAIALLLSRLIFELSSVETERRVKKGILTDTTAYDDELVAVRGRYDDVPLYFAVALNVIATIFTLVWGIIR